MKIIKKGNPYRKHKCSRCKTIYLYHLLKDRFDELSRRLQASKTQWELWNKMVNKNNEEIEVYQGVIDGYTKAAALNAQGKSKEAIDAILSITS